MNYISVINIINFNYNFIDNILQEVFKRKYRYINAFDTSKRHFTYVFWYMSMIVVFRVSDRAKVLSLSTSRPGSWAAAVSEAACHPGKDCTLSRYRHSAILRDICVFLKSSCDAREFFNQFFNQFRWSLT